MPGGGFPPPSILRVFFGDFGTVKGPGFILGYLKDMVIKII